MQTHHHEDIAVWVERLQQHPLPTIELKLERLRHFLELCGNPHQHLPPVIHVAGTNGKGSTLAFLHSILSAAGYRAHRYTSPHLVRFNERFIVADSEAGDALMLQGLEALEPTLDTCPLTYFEATTALAFHLFAATPADFTLLEVGMGGRLDATNVVDNPCLTVITPISFDHQEFLGETLADIAYEKAGIMKVGVPCVVGRQPPEALEVIKARAQEMHVPLIVLGEDITVELHGDGSWDYRTDQHHYHLPPPALSGIHQYDNAAVAVTCALHLCKYTDLSVNKAINEGITKAVWQGRLQQLDAPLVMSAFGIANPVYLDGGHNAAGALAVAEWMKAQPCPLHLVMGIKADKDAVRLMHIIAPYAASLTFVPLRDMPHHAPLSLCAIADKAGWQAHAASNVNEALHHIAKGSDVPIIITGSLYLIGEVLEESEK